MHEAEYESEPLMSREMSNWQKMSRLVARDFLPGAYVLAHREPGSAQCFCVSTGAQLECRGVQCSSA